MTAVVEVDNPLVEQIARAIAVAIAQEWGHDAEHPYVDEQARRLTPTVRATIERIKEAGRLLPEGITTDVRLTQQWGTRVADGHVIEWPDEEKAREQTDHRRGWGQKVALMHRWLLPAETTPWQETV